MALGALAGCSSSPYNLAPARGKVTCKGQPVANASVFFEPEQASSAKSLKRAEAVTNANGEFVLTTVHTGDGAIVGKHKVKIVFEDAYKHPPCAAPTNLTLEVKPGGNEFPIEMSQDGKK
jgi:hypothetical protein